MAGTNEQEVRPVPLEDLNQVLLRFEYSAVRAKWSAEGGGISTLDRGAEDVKAASRDLRKALIETEKIKANEDRTGAIVRAEGPCAIKVKDDTRVVIVALQGAGGRPTVAGVALPERTLTYISKGDIKVEDRTTAYLVLLGS